VVGIVVFLPKCIGISILRLAIERGAAEEFDCPNRNALWSHVAVLNNRVGIRITTEIVVRLPWDLSAQRRDEFPPLCVMERLTSDHRAGHLALPFSVTEETFVTNGEG
jgi:hypothetical protein